MGEKALGKGDSIGDRMKGHYENRTRYMLPRRTFSVVRVDGKAFHSFTHRMERPFDDLFMHVMNQTALGLCEEIQGAKLGFVQSDEISVCLTDFDDITTEAWFDGNVQKIASVAASIATALFASQMPPRWGGFPCFDGRVFTIPSAVEVENYFIWRQQDATRNSLQMAAHAQFSHKELHGLNTGQMQEKLFNEKGINWNDYPEGFKRGRCVVRREQGWTVEAPPIFTQQREYLSCIAPSLPDAVPSSQPPVTP